MNAPVSPSYGVIHAIDRAYHEIFQLSPDSNETWESFVGIEGIFIANSASLAATVCDALHKSKADLDNLFLSKVKSSDGSTHVIGLVRYDNSIFEIGDIKQGGYINAFGMPYRPPRDYRYSGYEYLWLYSFGRSEYILGGEEGWIFPQKTALEEIMPSGVAYGGQVSDDGLLQPSHRAPERPRNPIKRFFSFLKRLLTGA